MYTSSTFFQQFVPHFDSNLSLAIKGSEIGTTLTHHMWRWQKKRSSQALVAGTASMARAMQAIIGQWCWWVIQKKRKSQSSSSWGELRFSFTLCSTGIVFLGLMKSLIQSVFDWFSVFMTSTLVSCLITTLNFLDSLLKHSTSPIESRPRYSIVGPLIALSLRCVWDKRQGWDHRSTQPPFEMIVDKAKSFTTLAWLQLASWGSHICSMPIQWGDQEKRTSQDLSRIV